MGLIDLQLPSDLVSLAKLGQGTDISKEAARLIALELLREEQISLGIDR